VKFSHRSHFAWRRIVKTLAALLVVAGSSTALFAQDSTNFPSLGEVVRSSPALDELIAPDAKIEVIASGFDWTEGPLWVPDDQGGKLLFSDIPQNSIYEWRLGKGAKLFMKPSGFTGVGHYSAEPGSNGLLLDKDRRLVCCEHGDRRLSVLTVGGGKRTLADNYQGKRFNSPNDCAMKSNGDIYFTDPIYGLPKQENDPSREMDWCGVYRIATDGKVTLLTKEMTRPNGIGFSPDEKTLYVAQSDSAAAIWKTFEVKADGTLGAGKVFYDATKSMGKLPGAPDGFKIDQKGNLFATGPGGVYVLTPKGELLGRISTGERTANVAWGDDGSMLYMCADTYICRIKTKTKGNGWK
jgi:gluconolactonase